jgi:hypothetical protein
MRHWSIGGKVIPAGKLKYSKEKLPQYYFVHHKSHMDCLGSEPLSPHSEKLLTDHLNCGTTH